MIFALANQKPWLRDQCGYVLFQPISGDLSRNCSAQEEHAQSLIDKLSQSGLAKTREGVCLWIAVQNGYRSVHFPDGIWRDKDPLGRHALNQLAPVLLESKSQVTSTDPSEGARKDDGSTSTNLPFVWRFLGKTLADTPVTKGKGKSDKAGRVDLPSFWARCVDGESSKLVVWDSTVLICSRRVAKPQGIERTPVLGPRVRSRCPVWPSWRRAR